MKHLAPGLFQLKGFPPNAFNVYVMGDVLVDAGSRYASRRIMRQVQGTAVAAHALTHAHPDHQGSSRKVCEGLGVPFWVGRGDAVTAESGNLAAAMPDSMLSRASRAAFAGPGHRVERELAEGDEVGGFTVIETPGHSPGHISFWRESDRTLMLGDAVFNMNLLTALPGLHPPPDFFTPDIPASRRSAQRLAELEPRLICFGHGPPLRDTEKFVSFVRTHMG